MINKVLKRLQQSTRLPYFLHFFAVFSGIFIIMTTLILQISKASLYSSVDSSLVEISQNPTPYLQTTMLRSGILSDEEIDYTSKSKASVVANTAIVLFDKNKNPLNRDLDYAKISHLKNKFKRLNVIMESSVENYYGGKENYHYVTLKVKDSLWPDVAYMTAAVNVEQLVSTNKRNQSLIITIMVSFWIISMFASMYLATWTRKPIMENYEKQKSFVENASHELRTPLSVLQNRLEVLLRKPQTTVLDNIENIASSLDEVRNMRLLTTNLLNLARRDDGIQPEYTTITAKDIDAMIENYAMIAEENGKVFTAENQVKQSFKSDRTLFKQAVTILFDNAIKYTDEQGEIAISITSTERSLFVRVADNGFGISDSDKKKVFDRFYRVDKARTRQKGGFGLGLSLAQQIVKALKGTISIKDNQPKGTIFELKFPIK